MRRLSSLECLYYLEFSVLRNEINKAGVLFVFALVLLMGLPHYGAPSAVAMPAPDNADQVIVSYYGDQPEAAFFNETYIHKATFLNRGQYHKEITKPKPVNTEEILDSLGMPELDKREGDVVLWQYRSPFCVLDLHLSKAVDEETGATVRNVRYFESRERQAVQRESWSKRGKAIANDTDLKFVDASVCMSSIIRHNAGRNTKLTEKSHSLKISG